MVSRLLAVFALPVLLVGAIAVAQEAASRFGSPETVRIIAERTEVRREPNPKAGVLGTVGQGTVLRALGLDSGWVEVAYPVANGALYSGYVPAVFCEDARAAAPTLRPPAAAQAAELAAAGSTGASRVEGGR